MDIQVHESRFKPGLVNNLVDGNIIKKITIIDSPILMQLSRCKV